MVPVSRQCRAAALSPVPFTRTLAADMTTNVPELSVVVPCLNEAETIEIVLREARAALDASGIAAGMAGGATGGRAGRRGTGIGTGGGVRRGGRGAYGGRPWAASAPPAGNTVTWATPAAAP